MREGVGVWGYGGGWSEGGVSEGVWGGSGVCVRGV